jgi:hypothetical protein
MSSHSRRHRRSLDEVARQLATAARFAPGPGSLGSERLARQIAELDDGGPLVLAAADRVLGDAVASAWAGGWQPVDLWQIARRLVSESGAELMVAAIAADAARSASAALHPRWHAQLVELDARVSWPADRAFCAVWAGSGGLDLVSALTTVIDVVGELTRLPGQPKLIEPPGCYVGRSSQPLRDGVSRPVREIDPKVLAKVRALLAKAESTQFSEEADAFFGKAQELMSRYSLERAVVDAAGDAGGAIQTGGRRIWLDNPYPSPKSMLVNAVATANRCRAVFVKGLGFVTVVGEETDTEIVELLTTSLLLQASKSMLAEGSHVGWELRSRTRSFRQAFLVSYAQRISERLTEAAAHAEADVTSELAGAGGGQLVPVLAAREDAVARRMKEYFPRVVSRRVSVSNLAGWTAGRAAADLANLNVRKAVR